MIESVQRSITALIDGSPKNKTNTTRSRYGTHAMKISPPVWRRGATVGALSPSSRKVVRGFQTLSTMIITKMQVSELMMSVSSGPR